ncbi:MAG: chemotaxis protein CheW [Gemmatimonadaceae bacterium]
MDILVFELAGHRFGVSIERVREVVRAVEITPLPGAPQAVEGVIDVRGEVVPVFDLRARLGLGARRLHPDHHFVLAWARGRLAAMHVDRARWMASVPDGEMADARALAPHAEQITGVARMPDGLVLIHDLDLFLSPDEEAELRSALEQREVPAAEGA